MELLIILIVAVVVLGLVAGLALRDRGGGGTLEAPPRPEAPAPPRRPPAAPTLGDRLSRTRQAVGGTISGLLRRGTLDDSFWTDLEETLITGDVGVATASEVVERVRRSNPGDAITARDRLHAELVELFADRSRSLAMTGSPAVVVVLGVNGTGKTTSIGKLAHQLSVSGKRVVMGAADTFRAGASEQLRTWAERTGADFVGGEPNTDPAAVAYTALQTARDTGADVVIVDTAGRLHSNKNLMEELGKVVRVLSREAGEIDETLLVLDGTTGQNAIAQAATFTGAVGVSGIVLTKLDGTARGGVVVAVEQELNIPVKLIGVGEGLEDLVEFEAEPFVTALLGE